MLSVVSHPYAYQHHCIFNLYMDGKLSFFLYYVVLLSMHMTLETFFSNIHYLVVFLLVYDVALLTVLLVYIMICCLLQLAFDIPIVCTSGIHVLVFDALLHVQLVFDVHVVYTSGLCIV